MQGGANNRSAKCCRQRAAGLPANGEAIKKDVAALDSTRDDGLQQPAMISEQGLQHLNFVGLFLSSAVR